MRVNLRDSSSELFGGNKHEVYEKLAWNLGWGHYFAKMIHIMTVDTCYLRTRACRSRLSLRVLGQLSSKSRCKKGDMHIRTKLVSNHPKKHRPKGFQVISGMRDIYISWIRLTINLFAEGEKG